MLLSKHNIFLFVVGMALAIVAAIFLRSGEYAAQAEPDRPISAAAMASQLAADIHESPELRTEEDYQLALRSLESMTQSTRNGEYREQIQFDVDRSTVISKPFDYDRAVEEDAPAEAEQQTAQVEVKEQVQPQEHTAAVADELPELLAPKVEIDPLVELVREYNREVDEAKLARAQQASTKQAVAQSSSDSTVKLIPSELRSVLDNQILDEQDSLDANLAYSVISDQTADNAQGVNVQLTDAQLADSEMPLPANEDDNVTEPIAVTWPSSNMLHADLDYLVDFEMTHQWARKCETALLELSATPLNDPSSALPKIAELNHLIGELSRISGSIPAQYLEVEAWQELYSRMSRLQFRLQRRTIAWQQAANLMNSQPSMHRPINPTAVTNAVLASTSSLNSIEPNSHWNDYLLLDEVNKVFSESRFKEVHQQAIARKVLGRMTSPSLTDEQYRFAKQIIGDRLLKQLQQAATSPVDFETFLNHLERYEENPHSLDHYKFNSEFQNLYYSEHADARALADTVDNIYRNANLRITVSDDLINRALPAQPEFREPVTDHILGAQVMGNNRIRNRLHVQLVPDMERLNFRLVTQGTVFSRTRAHHHSGFTFLNNGNSQFYGVSEIVVSKQGMTANQANVNASTQQQLVGVRSNLDNVPLLGWASRQIARRQQQSSAPMANRVVEEKLANLTQSRVDQEVAAGLSELQNAFLRQIIYPLSVMELEPTPIDLRTTSDQIMIRYRLAGRDQMAAHTARPQESPGSLMSLQIHDSAINNILNKIEINGKRFTVEGFVQHLRDLTGNQSLLRNEDLTEHADVKFTFASRDGIHLEFVENSLKVSLSFKRLRIGNTQEWKNFTISAWYVPQFDGMKVQFLLDNDRGIQLHGNSLGISDELSLRTIFNTMLPDIYTLPAINQMVPAQIPMHGLAINQLVMSHGWVSLSIGGQVLTDQYRQSAGTLFRRMR